MSKVKVMIHKLMISWEGEGGVSDHYTFLDSDLEGVYGKALDFIKESDDGWDVRVRYGDDEGELKPIPSSAVVAIEVYESFHLWLIVDGAWFWSECESEEVEIEIPETPEQKFMKEFHDSILVMKETNFEATQQTNQPEDIMGCLIGIGVGYNRVLDVLNDLREIHFSTQEEEKNNG